uniref:Uncharacterized protein n=1 Tax=Sphaerodactylus townsendi TaxID=933632 RepID=A0ACB8ESY3_9SAUR
MVQGLWNEEGFFADPLQKTPRVAARASRSPPSQKRRCRSEAEQTRRLDDRPSGPARSRNASRSPGENEERRRAGSARHRVRAAEN